MITRNEGYYAISGSPVIVESGCVVSHPDDAEVEEFATEDALNEAYPVKEVEFGPADVALDGISVKVSANIIAPLP